MKYISPLLLAVSLLPCATSFALEAPDKAPQQLTSAAATPTTCLQEKVAQARSLYERGQVSYSDVLEAQEACLQEKLTAEGSHGEATMTELKKNYLEQIKIADLAGEKEKALYIRIKLQELQHGDPATLLDLYQQAIDFKKAMYQKGQCAMDEVLTTEIAYLKAALSTQDSSQQEKTEKLISQKYKMLQQLSKDRKPAEKE